MTQLTFRLSLEVDWYGGRLRPGAQVVVRLVDYLTTAILAEIVACVVETGGVSHA